MASPAPPLSCHGQRVDECTTVWISTIASTCYSESNQTCALAALDGTVDPNYVGGGLPWGMMVNHNLV